MWLWAVGNFRLGSPMFSILDLLSFPLFCFSCFKLKVSCSKLFCSSTNLLAGFLTWRFHHRIKASFHLFHLSRLSTVAWDIKWYNTEKNTCLISARHFINWFLLLHSSLKIPPTNFSLVKTKCRVCSCRAYHSSSGRLCTIFTRNY